MLFARAFDQPNLLIWIRRCRENPARLYGSALGLIAAATLVRLSLHQYLSTTSPFTFYNLAILCMAFVGGFWPGALTLILSCAIGAILFLPPAFSLTLAEGGGLEFVNIRAPWKHPGCSRLGLDCQRFES